MKIKNNKNYKKIIKIKIMYINNYSYIFIINLMSQKS